jgi:hypothetical protein
MMGLKASVPFPHTIDVCIKGNVNFLLSGSHEAPMRKKYRMLPTEGSWSRLRRRVWCSRPTIGVAREFLHFSQDTGFFRLALCRICPRHPERLILTEGNPWKDLERLGVDKPAKQIVGYRTRAHGLRLDELTTPLAVLKEVVWLHDLPWVTPQILSDFLSILNAACESEFGRGAFDVSYAWWLSANLRENNPQKKFTFPFVQTSMS